MEIHWIAVLLTLAWVPKSSFTISNNYNNQNQQQGSDWTIDKAKLIYHFSSTEQYNPSLRQAKSIFPIEPSTSNRHQDDNTQNRYHQQQQQYRNYNNNHNNNIQPPLPQPTSTFVSSRLRQYPPVANQFSSHWRNLSPPAGPQQPPQSYPPVLNVNQLKITRPSLPDMLPAIIQSQNTAGASLTNNFQSPNFQYHGNSDTTNKNNNDHHNVSFASIDARIVSKPSLDVPTPNPNANSQVPLLSPPKFSPVIPTPQNLIGYGNSQSESVVATKKPQPFPVYGPPKPLDSTNINSQLIQPPVLDANIEGPIVNHQVSTTLNPDREIRFLIHKPGDEDIIKNVISEESKNTNEQVSFINGPTLHLQRKQKIYLPPKKKTIVYVLLKEPQIETDVEVMEQEVDPKPEVYIIYQKGKDMLTRHYSADDNTLKSVKDIPIPPSETEKLLLHSAASKRRETVVKAPTVVAATAVTTPNPTATMCLNTPLVASSSSSSSSSSKNNIKITTKDSTVKPTTKS